MLTSWRVLQANISLKTFCDCTRVVGAQRSSPRLPRRVVVVRNGIVGGFACDELRKVALSLYKNMFLNRVDQDTTAFH